MSHYIRYLLTDDKGLTLPEIESAVPQIHPGYAIDEDILVFDDGEYGKIELNVAGDEFFESDIELLEGFASEKENKEMLLATLKASKSMVVVQVIWELSHAETLKALEPLFDWLLTNHSGLLVEEGGAFFNREGLIV